MRARESEANLDERWMRVALDLARRGEGLTRPNPPVGAVVVQAGRKVGQGFHRRAGGPHAEVYALRQAGARARGATLYVTLEPCSTWGRTPPCTEAVLGAGIRRVVVAMRDPNPKHGGRGLRLLRQGGAAVTEGICGEAAENLLAPFRQWITARRPYVTLKLGMSLDGRIADRRGRSQWITGPAARRAVQALRRRSDAVMVGIGTALADDPSLLPRPARGRCPWRVIVDSRGRLPLQAKVLNDGQAGQTIIATTVRCAPRRQAGYRTKGAAVWVLPARSGRVALGALLRRLHGLGALHVLCEGGGDLAEALIRGRQVDEYAFFVAPRLLGGHTSAGAVGGAGWPLASTPRLRITGVTRVGGDLMVRATRI